jgi:hypothetical protein
MASSSLEPPELLEAQPEQELASISPERTAVAAPLPSRDELYAMGKTLRSKFPRKAHAEWKPAADRPDPVELVLRAEADHCRRLLPLRHGPDDALRVHVYRGAALAMACDLASTPSPGFASSAVEIRSSGGPHLSGDWLELVHWRILVPEGYRPARCGDGGATSAARPHGVFV